MPKVFSTLFAAYNGYVFNNTAKTTAIRIDPVLSSDQRAILYNRWSITIKFEIATAFGKTDPDVLNAITSLTHPAAVFLYRDRGLGNPDINTGVATDLKWGPIPKVVNVELIGAGNAVEITWSVEFHVANCPGAYNPFGLLELSVTVEHAQNDAGFITRTTSGFIQIVNNRNFPGDRRPIDSADTWWGSIPTPEIEGFHRVWQPRRLAPDQSRLDFGWSDREMPVVLPVGIVEAHFEDDVGSTGAGLARWAGTLSGSYRMANGYNWLTGIRAFFEMALLVLQERQRRLLLLDAFRPAGARPAGVGQLAAPQAGGRIDNQKIKTAIIPTAFRMKNPDRYGEPQASCSLNYTFSCPLADLLAATGMYMPFVNDWRLWSASLQDSALNPYGKARMVFLPQDSPDIVDACWTPGAVLRGGWNPPPIPVPPDQLIPREAPVNQGVATLVAGTFAKPQPGNSWVDYDCEIFVEADTGIIQSKKLPRYTPDPAAGTFAENGLVPPMADATTMTGYVPNPLTGALGGFLNNIIQPRGILRRVNESVVLYLRGSAVRAGYPIYPPRLVSVNGVAAVPDCRPDRGEGFGTGIKANGVNAIHYAYWNLRYILDEVPAFPLPVPTNPGLDPR